MQSGPVVMALALAFGVFLGIAMSSPVEKSAVDGSPRNPSQLLEHFKTKLALLKARAATANRDLSVTRSEKRLIQLYQDADSAIARLQAITNRNGAAEKAKEARK